MQFEKISVHVAQWIRHRPPKPRIVGSSPTVGKLFHDLSKIYGIYPFKYSSVIFYVVLKKDLIKTKF